MLAKHYPKITTIIYISTKISGFKNSCNDKRGIFSTVKNDTVDKICKICNEKNKFALKRFTLLFFIQTLETVHITTQNRKASQPSKMCYIQVL